MKPFRPLVPALALIGMATAGDLKLPDILALPDGTQATLVKEWEKTLRPQTLELFREHIYGRNPVDKPADFRWTLGPAKEDAAAPGVTIADGVAEYSGPGGKGSIKVRVVRPKDAEVPLPLFLLINNRSPELSDLGKPNEFWPALEIAKRGYATAIFHNADVDPDKDDGFKDGVHGIFDSPLRKPDAWGSIAAWSWGASRVIDGLFEESDIDRSRIAVVGHSRGGKAALWCGAQDPRVALTISNESGSTGAALSRRIHGETIADINKNFPHWFCENYKRYNGKEQELPVDQHQLIGLLAPRLAYVASAAEDDWADPQGEFLSCVHAVPVYRLYDKQGLESDKMPEVGGHLHGGSIGYHIRPGKHDLTLVDWKNYLDFADRHWKRGE